MSPPASYVADTARRLIDLYRLDLELDAAQYLIEPEVAQRILSERSSSEASESGGDFPWPRSGLLLVQEGSDLQVGLYLHPADEDDHDTVVEETSHLLCIAWHASRNLQVSRLLLELQGDVDRYVIARMAGRDGLDHFEGFGWASWMDESTRSLYTTAHEAARRYCRGLSVRFPRVADTPGLLMELRGFYRASLEQKLHAG